MLNIHVETIPHSKHRYETVGDWFWSDDDKDEGTLFIRVSKMSDWRYEFLVAVHEMVEAMLCKIAGVREKDIKAFDENFERERSDGFHTGEEPGADPKAPYRKQHMFAECIERMLAVFCGVDWTEYDREVMGL